MHLTSTQQQALDTAGARPAHVAVDGVLSVLLPSADFDWVREIVADVADVPRLTDPRTQQSYALVPAAAYERFKAFFEEDPLSPAERSALLRERGKRAGWDDPAWDAQRAVSEELS